MKNFLTKIFNHAFFAIGTALGAGVLGMVALVQLYDYFWGKGTTESVVENPVERALSDGNTEGPLKTLYVSHVPGPFLSREDGSPVGYVFIDVSVEVSGEEAFTAANENLDTLIARFTEALKTTGVGKADRPGEVDYDRLAKTFLALARDEVHLRGIMAVRVSEAEEP